MRPGEMKVNLDRRSLEARDGRRIVLDLMAANRGGKEIYRCELERLLNDLFASGAPPERTAYLLDAAVQVAGKMLGAWSVLLDASEQDVMHLLESEWTMDTDD